MSGHEYLHAFIKGFVITQLVEIPVVLYILTRHFHRISESIPFHRIIATAFFANMATLPYLWFFYPEFLSFSTAVAVGEMTALVVEGAIYCFTLGATMRAAFIASLAANCSSVLVGLILMPPFGRV